MEKMTINELMREYVNVRNRLDVAESIMSEGITSRAEASAKIKALEAVEAALTSLIDLQKARIRDLKKEIEKDANLVNRHLRKMPDFMIVSITDRGNLQVCGECPTPRDLHRHSAYYEDHPGISKAALYAKIEFPYEEDDDTMAVMRPEPLEALDAEVVMSHTVTIRKGDTMPEEKTEEPTEESGGEILGTQRHKRDEKREEPTEKPITVEAEDQEPITIEIGEPHPGTGIPDDWVKHLNTYTEVMKECYDRALSVCVLPDITAKMALAMYNTIAGSQNAAYREFLDGLQAYLTKLNEPPPELQSFGPPVGFERLFSGATPPDFQKPSEPRKHPGIDYDRWMIITEYPNGDYHVSHYHEGFEVPAGSPTGKGQAIDFYRKVREHPTVRKAYLVMNISDQIPSENDIEQGAPVDRSVCKEQPAKEPEGESE